MISFKARDNINFPINYELYIIPVIEKIQSIKSELNPLVIKIGYNLLYLLSICQIHLNKIKNLMEPYRQKLITYLKDNNIIVEEKTKIINIIDKNSNIQTDYILNDNVPILQELENIFNDKIVSGIILNDKNVETSCINKIYIEKESIVKYFPIEDYKVSKINFLMLELQHENEKYLINLKNKLYNYYIVNNTLNQNFFKYYLKNILKVTINDDHFYYTLNIVDHNVNILNINQDQYIIIQEYGYEIFPENISNNTIDNIENNTDNSFNDCDNDSDKYEDFIKLESTN